MSVLTALFFLLLMWAQGRPLWKKRLFWDLAVVLALYLLAAVPAVMLAGGSDKVPPVNTAIRIFVQKIIGK